MADNISGIHHISMKCNSEELFSRTVGFYRDILMLKIYRVWKDGIMFDAGSGVIEIFSTGTDLPDEGVIRHYALAVRDPDALAERIRAAGYEITVEPKDIVIPSDPPLKARIAFCRGPVGEIIELFCEKFPETED